MKEHRQQVIIIVKIYLTVGDRVGWIGEAEHVKRAGNSELEFAQNKCNELVRDVLCVVPEYDCSCVRKLFPSYLWVPLSENVWDVW